MGVKISSFLPATRLFAFDPGSAAAPIPEISSASTARGCHACQSSENQQRRQPHSFFFYFFDRMICLPASTGSSCPLSKRVAMRGCLVRQGGTPGSSERATVVALALQSRLCGGDKLYDHHSSKPLYEYGLPGKLIGYYIHVTARTSKQRCAYQDVEHSLYHTPLSPTLSQSLTPCKTTSQSYPTVHGRKGTSCGKSELPERTQGRTSPVEVRSAPLGAYSSCRPGPFFVERAIGSERAIPNPAASNDKGYSTLVLEKPVFWPHFAKRLSW
ncbi:hypothetical protein LX36DRAFT_274593 [Colletotrichum falcatum]|nr:hypothetical protein LX36DRAFT_274593 [Colletotrichum falcatum]